MKIKILTIVLSLTLFNSNAQVLESIGIKGGLSLANQSFESKTLNSKQVFDYKLGAYSAITAEFFKLKHMSLVTDLGYVQKGMQVEVQETTPQMPEGTGKFNTWKSTIGYLTFSPMLKGFYDFKRFTVFAFVGPRVDYRLSIDSKYYTPLYEDSKKQVFGLNYGVGASYNLNRISLSMEFMAQPDFTPIINQKPEPNFPGFKVYNNAYMLNMGLSYRFR